MQISNNKNRFIILFALSVLCILIFTTITFINIRSTEVVNKKIHEYLTELQQLKEIDEHLQIAKDYRYKFLNTRSESDLNGITNYIDSLKHRFQVYQVNFNKEDTFTRVNNLVPLVNDVAFRKDSLINIFKNAGFSATAAFIISGNDKFNDLENGIKRVENALRKNLVEDGGLSRKVAEDTTSEFVKLFIMFILFLFALLWLMLKETSANQKYVDELKYNKSLLKSISQPIITLNNDYKITGWNKYAMQLYGWKEEDVLGHNFIQLLQVEFINTSMEAFTSIFKNADRWEGEMIHVTRDNKELQVKAIFSSINDKQGAKKGTVAVFSDITEIKEMSRKLRVLSTNLEREVTRKVTELNHFFERIKDAFFAVDNNWNYTYVNQKAAELHNSTIEELIGKNIWEIHPDQVGGDFYNAMMQASKSMMPVKSDFYYEKYGMWFEDAIFPSADGVSVYYQDVTDKKIAEIKLEEAENLFRNMVEASMVGVYIMQKGNFAYINPRGAEMLGYDSEDVIENYSVLDLIAPEYHEVVKENVKKRESGEVKSIHYELQALHKDGHYIDMEAFGSFSLYKGEPAIIGTIIDISERKKFENERRKLQERLELVIRATNDAIWDWDLETNRIVGNEAFNNISGISANSSISFEEYLQRLNKEDAERVKTNLERSMQQKKDTVVEVYQYRMPDGKMIYVNDRSYILYNDEGVAYRMLGSMQDITKQTESANHILQQKKLAENIINSLPGVFYIYNLDLKLLLWNKNFEKFTGFSKEDIRSMGVYDFLIPEDKERANVTIQNIISKGEDMLEAELRYKDGRRVPYYLTGMSIEYEGETCIMGVGLDVSDKREALLKLQRSEDSFRTLIEQASDGIFITNVEGELLIVNSSASEMTGLSSHELIGKKLQDFITHENGNPLNLKDNDVEGNVLISEGLLLVQDGSLINIEWSSKKLHDDRYQYFIRDITKRRISEQYIRESEHKYRLLFEQNPMPMWMLSLPDKNFLAVNEAAVKFYGYSKDEFLELNIEDIRPLKSRNTSNFAEAFKSGIQNAEISEMVKKNGDKVRVQIIAHDIIYEDQIAELELANDMTEKIKAEEDLKKSHEDLRMLASYLEKARESERTHIAREIHDELGQQITGLKMDISWLYRRMENSEPVVKEKLKEIMALLDGTVKFVRNLATKLRPSLLDDLGLVAAMEWQTEEFQKRTGIKTEFSASVTQSQFPQDVSTNFFRIYQESLTNILRHANASQVTVTLNQNDGIIELIIRDNGVGFEQKDNFQKHTLGLLGMKERTLEMNGTFEINSKPNMGTTIYIAVPLNA